MYADMSRSIELKGDLLLAGGMSVLEGQLATSLWLCHVMVVLWGIAFPFHARRTLDNPKQRRCLHITILFLSTITSLAILAATVASGDFITQFPPTHCVLTNANAAYSLQLLPASIKCAVAASSMTLTFWLLIINRHVSGLTICSQEAINNMVTCTAK